MSSKVVRVMFAITIPQCSRILSRWKLEFAPCLLVSPPRGAPRGYRRMSPPSNLNAKELFLFRSIPCLEGTSDPRLYRPSAVGVALAKLRATGHLDETWVANASALPIFMAMAKALYDAMPQYRSTQRLVEKKNRAFVAALAKKNELSYGQMIASPTLARYFNTFSRDLTQISDTVWETIRDVCLAEVTLRMRHNNRCPFCPRGQYIKKDAHLQKHIQD
ncbi:hypothetical protein B0H13DRAFT_2536998 [Mycena leptocephala]|nr:hypothetical protein B0H13DRAFT_2536998 [Mycena leptocephala]